VFSLFYIYVVVYKIKVHETYFETALVAGDMDFFSGSSILLQCDFNLVLYRKGLSNTDQLLNNLGHMTPLLTSIMKDW
jgi:hypothetical protein